jgi:6-pyruvoyltetrahydropterin/6-carboxytetrahydropterin synthase
LRELIRFIKILIIAVNEDYFSDFCVICCFLCQSIIGKASIIFPYLCMTYYVSTMIYITRRETFNAAHRLFRKEWSDEKNFEVFGRCSNPNWHGHNYELFITIRGEIDTKTGFVMNLKQLSHIIKTKVIDKLDHKNINLEVDFMAARIASTENIAIGIWDEIWESIIELGAELHCVKLAETENNFVEYFGT